MKKSLMARLAIVGALSLSLLWILSCALDPVTRKPGLMLVSKEKESEIGKQTDVEVTETYGIYDDAGLNAYVNEIGQRMGKLSHRPELSYEFKVLDGPVVNAFAVPGGYVYVTRGILAYINSEAELAGVVGHEIGHVTARHTAEQISKAQVAQIGLAIGGVVSETFRQVSQFAQFGVSMLFLKFSRDNERESDDLGVEYSTKAGYDAEQMAGFFETLERLHPSDDRSGLQGWFTTHPNPPDRIEAIKAKASEWVQAQGVDAKSLKVDREAYLRHIDGIVFGEDPREGFVEADVFYHPGLKFQFPVPANWKLNNTRSQVQILEANKEALILFSLAPGKDPKEAAREFISKTKAGVLQFESVKVNGLPAQRLISDITIERGVLRVMSYFIQKDDRIYVFHGLSSQRGFSAHQTAFQGTMEAFKEVTDSRILDVKPDRLRIRNAKAAGPLKEVLADLGVSEKELETTAILNGRQLDEPVEAGALLKVVEKGR